MLGIQLEQAIISALRAITKYLEWKMEQPFKGGT